MVRPAAKREAVVYLREHFQMSERRACSVLAYSTPFGHAFHEHPASHSTNIRPPVP